MPSHIIYRTQHTVPPTRDADGKLKKLRNWKHWRKYGLRGEALEKRTHMSLKVVRKWAADLNFDLEGLA